MIWNRRKSYKWAFITFYSLHLDFLISRFTIANGIFIVIGLNICWLRNFLISKAHYRRLYQIEQQIFRHNTDRFSVENTSKKVHNGDVKILTLRSHNGKLAEVNILCTQQSRKAGTREKNPRKINRNDVENIFLWM